MATASQNPVFSVVKSQYDDDRRSGSVTVECDLADFPRAIEMLRDGHEAVDIALTNATTHGVQNPGIGTRHSPYPVNARGDVIDFFADEEPHRYRVDIDIRSSLP